MKYITTILFSLLLSTVAFAQGSPSSAKINVYGVAVSTKADCSNPRVIGYNTTPTTYDLLTNPALLSGNVAAGTYQCIVLIMDAALTFIPAATVGNCTGGTTYQRVLCTGNCTYQSFTIDANKNLTYGATKAGSAANSSDWANKPQVLLFLSTGSTATGNGNTAFEQPTVATNGLNLASPFVVGASGATGTFVINFAGQVNGNQNPCDLGPPTFGFR